MTITEQLAAAYTKHLLHNPKATQYTQGEWKVLEIQNEKGQYVIVDKNNNFVAASYAADYAHLMAAAPKMLEALRNANDRGYFDPHPDDNEIETDDKLSARAAIAAAKGE